MSSQKQKKRNHSILRNNKGFTLIELAIVLVIIGLILGSVLKGKDLINSAKQKNFYSSFLKNWQLSVASYYDRTGYVLGDGPPNGGTATVNGSFDNVSGATFGATDGIDDTLKRVGLDVPESNAANSGQVIFKGAYSGSRTITMQLYNLYSHTDLRHDNRLYLNNVPTDLAIALDTIIDGEMNSATGSFRYYPDNTDPMGGWPDASTTAVVNCSLLVDI
ncbi:MAG: prepilin-type N-terminal cleavage/methylation domain-containing protein [Desulfocapsa sp.]|nr:prepilin-type N-terminal cleavage/methylation domain-containing protein [Desulfocapsa sp.]